MAPLFVVLVMSSACGNEGDANAPQNVAGTSVVGGAGGFVPAVAGSSSNASTGGDASARAGSGGANSGAAAPARPMTAGTTAVQPQVAGAGASATGGAGSQAAGAQARAGSTGSAGSMQPSAAGGAATVAASACKGKASQGIIIGDSYINWPSHTLPADLAREAGETWRLYAVGGASLQAGGIVPQFIKDQFEQAIGEDPDIKLLVMDGGGNDVLLSDAIKYPGSDACKASDSSKNPVCQKIVVDTLATFDALIKRAVEVGVQHIVYFFYPGVPDGTALGGPQPNEIADYARPMWKAACESANAKVGGKLSCHFVDMAPVFKGHDAWFAPADIHPTPEGSAAMAKAIVSKMKEDCVWQPKGSACCP